MAVVGNIDYCLLGSGQLFVENYLRYVIWYQHFLVFGFDNHRLRDSPARTPDHVEIYSRPIRQETLLNDLPSVEGRISSSYSTIDVEFEGCP